MPMFNFKFTKQNPPSYDRIMAQIKNRRRRVQAPLQLPFNVESDTKDYEPFSITDFQPPGFPEPQASWHDDWRRDQYERSKLEFLASQTDSELIHSMSGSTLLAIKESVLEHLQSQDSDEVRLTKILEEFKAQYPVAEPVDAHVVNGLPPEIDTFLNHGEMKFEGITTIPEKVDFKLLEGMHPYKSREDGRHADIIIGSDQTEPDGVVGVSGEILTLLTHVGDETLKFTYRRHLDDYQMMRTISALTPTAVSDAAAAATDAKVAVSELRSATSHIQGQVDFVAGEVKELIPEAKNTLGVVSSSMKSITDQVSGIVPYLQSSITSIMQGLKIVGAATIGVVVLTALFKLLSEFVTRTSIKTQVTVLKIVAGGLMIAGMTTVIYKTAAGILYEYANELREAWDKSRTDALPKRSNVADNVCVVKAESGFILRRQMHFAWRTVQIMVKALKSGFSVAKALADTHLFKPTEGFTEQELLMLRYLDNDSEKWASLTEAEHDAICEQQGWTCRAFKELSQYYFHVQYGEPFEDEKKFVSKMAEEIKTQSKKAIEETYAELTKLNQKTPTVGLKLFNFLNKSVRPKRYIPLGHKESDSGDEFNAYADKDGPNSLLAMLLAIVTKIQNPSTDVSELFGKLRTDSGKFKVALSGFNQIVDIVPERLRISAYEHLGFAGPTDCTKQEKEVISRGYAIYGLAQDAKSHTAHTKRIYMACFKEVADLLQSAKFLVEHGSYTKKLAQDLYTKMANFMPNISCISDNEGFRLQTIGVWLWGMPGTGKSVLLSALAKRFAEGYPMDMRSHTWALNEKFMSSYNGHWGIDVDDAGSNIQLLQDLGFFQKLLTYLSTKPCQLDMAFKKGLPFTSHAMLISSNASLDHILTKSAAGNKLTNPEAVKRRFRGFNGIEAEVKVHPRFLMERDGKMVSNEAAITAEAERYPGEFRHMIFVVEGRELNFSEFAAKFAACYGAAISRYSKMMKQHSQTAKKDNLVAAVAALRNEAGLGYTKSPLDFSLEIDSYQMPNAKLRKAKKRVIKEIKNREGTVDSELSACPELKAKYDEVLRSDDGKHIEPTSTELKEAADAEHACYDLTEDSAPMISWNTVSEYGARLWEKFTNAFDEVCRKAAKIDWKTVAVALAATIGVVTAISHMWSWLSDTKTVELNNEEESQSPNERAEHDVSGGRYRAVRNRNYGRRKPADSWQNGESKEDFLHILEKNTAFFTPGPNFRDDLACRCNFIVGRHLLMNAHYTAGLQLPAKVAFCKGGVEFNATMHEKDIYRFKNEDGSLTDMLIWSVPSMGSRTPNDSQALWKHYVPEALLNESYHDSDFAPLYLLGGNPGAPYRRKVPSAVLDGFRSRTARHVDGKLATIDRTFFYGIPTVKGDCGLVLTNGRHILSVHFMGRRGTHGIGQVVTREMLEGFLEDYQSPGIPHLNESSLDSLPSGSYHGEYSDMRGAPQDGAFIVEASLPKPVNAPRDTRLIPSGLAENGSAFAVRCAKIPAILSPDDPRYKGTATLHSQFLADLMVRYAHRPIDLPQNLVRAAVSKLVNEIRPTNVPCRVWSLDEALNPAKLHSCLNPLPRSTSPGVLFNGPGKRRYIKFDEDSQTYFPSEEFRARMEKVETLAGQGENPLFIFFECPKDELLKPTKIEQKNCRSVSGSPLDLTMLTKQCFGAFLDAFHDQPFEWGHAVGVDVLSPDWDIIIRQLKANGRTHGFDGDFRHFDSTMRKMFMLLFFEYVDLWYKRHGEWSLQDRLKRYVCIYNMVHSKHVCGRTVFTKFMGLPSGSLMTTIMNCFWARTLLLVCYAELAPNDRALGLQQGTFLGYDRYVKTFVLGDDNFSGVDDKISAWFNALDVARVLSKYNIEYTPARKEDELSRTNGAIEGMEFLACTTVTGNVVPGMRYYPYIKEGSLTKCVAYIRKCSEMTPLESIDTNIFQSLHRVFFSGETRFNEFRDDTVNAFHRLAPGYDKPFPTYEEIALQYQPLHEHWMEVPQDEFQMMGSASPQVVNVTTGYDDPIVMNSAGDVIRPPDHPIVETPQTLRALVKRSYAFVNTAGVGAATRLWFRLSSVFGQGKEPYQLYSPLDKLASYFRVWSGPVSITAYSDQKMDLQFYPELQGQPSATKLFQDPSIPPISSGATGFGLGYNYCPSGIGYVNARVPFTTNNHCSLIPHFASDLGEESNTGVVEVNATDDSIPVAVTLTSGDGLEFAVRFAVPTMICGTANVAPDEWQGITMSSNKYHVGTIQDSGVEMNQANSAEAKSSIDAKMGNDAPNIPTQLVSVLRQTTQYGSSAQRVDFNPTMAITNEIEGPNMLTANTGNNMDIRELCGPTARDTFNWSTSDPQGAVLWSSRICPNALLKRDGFGLGVTLVPTSLASVSTLFAKWRGSLRYGFSPIISGTHTGRLGISVVFGTDTQPANLAEATSQRYTVFEVSAENRKCVVEVPYVAPKRLMDTYRGQSDSTKWSTGIISLFVLNELRCPDSAAATITVVASEAAAPDTQFYLPFASGSSIRYVYEDVGQLAGKPREGLETKDEFQMDTPEVSGEEKVGVIETETNHHHVEEVNSVVPDTGEVRIIGQPYLSFQQYLERKQWIANFDWSITNNFNTILYDRPVPLGMLENTAKRAFEAFKFAKLDAVVTLKVQATQFHSGRLIMFHTPMVDDAEAKAVFLARGVDRRRQTFLEHCFADANTSTSVSLRIPFRYLRPYLVEGENFSHLFVSVFSPLAVGTGGDSTATCTMYVHFEKTDMRVIRPL